MCRFESQRAKEQLLIERGEQYKRAIQLFVKKMNRYPGTIEELESTNNIRFLRKRFVDPMTGKSEWRLIHVGAGGVFTDSKVQFISITILLFPLIRLWMGVEVFNPVQQVSAELVGRFQVGVVKAARSKTANQGSIRFSQDALVGVQ